jgi:arylsulfatase A-like enzyme
MTMNVIWIFGDQHRGQMMSCAGDPNLNTPNMDILADLGVRFPSAVAGFPLCCPFRGSLLTSRYPHHCVPGHEYPLPDGMPTLANAFSERGYDTAWFGKWHVAGYQEKNGRAAFYTVPRSKRGGFRTWLGYDNNNSQWDSWVHGHDRNGTEIERYRLPGYETDCLSDLLIEYIREQGQAKASGKPMPFFAALSVQPPHNPYVAPPEYMARHNPALVRFRPNVPPVDSIRSVAAREYAGACAMVENLDWNLGRIREALADTDLGDETILMFFSDHGDMHGSHGQFRKTCPWEESIRIPLIVGGGLPLDKCRHGLPDCVVNHVDLAPTTLGLCGIEKPAWMDGFDYSGFFRKDRPCPAPPDSAYLQCVIPTGHGESVDRPWRGIVTRDGWKYVCLEGQPWLLFNLNEDPYEMANLAHNTRCAKERSRLHARLRQWIADTKDDFPLPVI